MNAWLERDWARAGYHLYLYQERPNYRVPISYDGERFVYDRNATVQVGENLPPTFFIPDEFYTAIRAAMIGEAIDNDDALKDTRTIRDRLLAMIESEWQSRQLEKK